MEVNALLVIVFPDNERGAAATSLSSSRRPMPSRGARRRKTDRSRDGRRERRKTYSEDSAVSVDSGGESSQ